MAMARSIPQVCKRNLTLSLLLLLVWPPLDAAATFVVHEEKGTRVDPSEFWLNHYDEKNGGVPCDMTALPDWIAYCTAGECKCIYLDSVFPCCTTPIGTNYEATDVATRYAVVVYLLCASVYCVGFGIKSLVQTKKRLDRASKSAAKSGKVMDTYAKLKFCVPSITSILFGISLFIGAIIYSDAYYADLTTERRFVAPPVFYFITELSCLMQIIGVGLTFNVMSSLTNVPFINGWERSTVAATVLIVSLAVFKLVYAIIMYAINRPQNKYIIIVFVLFSVMLLNILMYKNFKKLKRMTRTSKQRYRAVILLNTKYSAAAFFLFILYFVIVALLDIISSSMKNEAPEIAMAQVLIRRLGYIINSTFAVVLVRIVEFRPQTYVLALFGCAVDKDAVDTHASSPHSRSLGVRPRAESFVDRLDSDVDRIVAETTEMEMEQLMDIKPPSSDTRPSSPPQQQTGDKEQR